jgi:hypothetical protein
MAEVQRSAEQASLVASWGRTIQDRPRPWAGDQRRRNVLIAHGDSCVQIELAGRGKNTMPLAIEGR